jgi:AraC-like DNA-binding protein
MISGEAPGARERIPPSESIHLGFNLHEDALRVYDATDPHTCTQLSGAVVSGPRVGPVVIDTRELTAVMGVRFRPGGAAPFLGVPADELTNTRVGLETFWGTAARGLREQLCIACTPKERFARLEQGLLARLRHRRDQHYAVSFALERFRGSHDTRTSVREVARETGLSQRRFIQVFTREIGLTPKLFCRIGRFRHALERLRAAAEPNWARLAADCGYYDQSHLVRDFRSFSDLSPTEFLRLRSRCAVQNHATVVG